MRRRELFLPQGLLPSQPWPEEEAWAPHTAYGVRLTGFQALALPLHSCAILDQLPCLSVPLFAHCQ